MDSLRDLPIDDKSVLNDQQKMALDKYVGSAPTTKDTENNDITPKWKSTLYISALFLALLNPVTQGFLSKIPRVGDSYISILALTALIFGAGTACILYFA